MQRHLILSQSSLTLSFILFLFLSAVQLEYFPPTSLSLNCWAVQILLNPLNCCWFPLLYFSFHLLYSSLIGSFFIYSTSMKSSQSSSILWNLVTIFKTIPLNLLSSKLLKCVSFSSFSDVLSSLILGKLLCLHFLFLLFYGLGKWTTSPSPEGMALCRNIPWIHCMWLVVLGGSLQCRWLRVGVSNAGAPRAWSRDLPDATQLGYSGGMASSWGTIQGDSRVDSGPGSCL